MVLPASNSFLLVCSSVLPHTTVVVMRVVIISVRHATTHTWPTLATHHPVLLCCIDGTSDKHVHGGATKIAWFAARLDSTSLSLLTPSSLHCLLGSLPSLPRRHFVRIGVASHQTIDTIGLTHHIVAVITVIPAVLIVVVSISTIVIVKVHCRIVIVQYHQVQTNLVAHGLIPSTFLAAAAAATTPSIPAVVAVASRVVTHVVLIIGAALRPLLFVFCPSFRVATLATGRDLIPIPFPFFPPIEWTLTNHTDLAGKVFFLDDLSDSVAPAFFGFPHLDCRCGVKRPYRTMVADEWEKAPLQTLVLVLMLLEGWACTDESTSGLQDGGRSNPSPTAADEGTLTQKGSTPKKMNETGCHSNHR